MVDPEPARLSRSSSRSRRHSRSVTRRLRHFLAEWWAEILIGMLLAAGIFLLFERMQIRQTLLRWLQSGWALLLGMLGSASSGLARFVQSRTISDLVGFVLLGAAVGAIGWRVRWRLLNSPRFTDRSCPHCKGTLHRVHRHGSDRIVNVVVPVRRYRCDNRACGWSGLRFGRGHHD